MDPDEDFKNRLDDPAKFVSPYPSFYEGPRVDLDDEFEPEQPSSFAGARNDDDTTLFVGNLDHRVADTLLYELFSQIGYIRDVNFPKQDPEKPAVFCFVNFAKIESVPHAIERLQGYVLFGRNLVLRCRPKSVHAGKYGYLYKQKPKQQIHEDAGRLSPAKCQQQLRVVVMRGSDLPVIEVKTGFEPALKELKETGVSSVIVSPSKPCKISSKVPRSESPNLSPVSETSLQDVVSPRKAENVPNATNDQPESAETAKGYETTDGHGPRRNVVFRNKNDQADQYNNQSSRRHQNHRQGPPNPSQTRQPYQHFQNNGYSHNSGYYNSGYPGSYYPPAGPPGPYSSGPPGPDFSYYNNQMQRYQPQHWNLQGWNHQQSYSYAGTNTYPQPYQYDYTSPGYYAQGNYNGYPPPPVVGNPQGHSRSQYQWVNSNHQWSNSQNPNCAAGSHPYELIPRRRSASPSKSTGGYTTSDRRSRSRSRSSGSRRYSIRSDRRTRSRSRSHSPSRSRSIRYRSRSRTMSRSRRNSSSTPRGPRSTSKELSVSASRIVTDPVMAHRTRSSSSRRSADDDAKSDTSCSSRSARRQKFASEKYSSDRC